MSSQQLGLEIEAAEPTETGEKKAAPAAPRLKKANRAQLVISLLDLERLIPADHLARAIESLVQKLPDVDFLENNKSVEGHAGRPRTDPRLLVAIWVYAYSQGIGEAEAIAEEMKYEPALRWLAGNQTLSSRTLSGFRVVHEKALRNLFAELLGMLSQLGLVDLSQVTIDGTKIKAAASAGSFRREPTLREHIARAAEVIAQQEQPGANEAYSIKKQAALKRAAAERQTRLEQSLQELEQIRRGKTKAEQVEARVSLTDPEARNMKGAQGGYAPSYNVQLTTTVKHPIIVDVAVTQQGFDQQQLAPALARLPQLSGQVLVDGGYLTAESIAAAERAGVELIGPEFDPAARAAAGSAAALKQAGIAPEYGPSAFKIVGQELQCPAGKSMARIAKHAHYTRYQAKRADCRACAHRLQCCPQSGQRTVKIFRERPEVTAFAERMKEDRNKEIYRLRGPVAEFPNAWIKAKHGLRQFHVRGLAKVTVEALWSVFTYNIQQWFRLVWRPALMQA